MTSAVRRMGWLAAGVLSLGCNALLGVEEPVEVSMVSGGNGGIAGVGGSTGAVAGSAGAAAGGASGQGASGGQAGASTAGVGAAGAAASSGNGGAGGLAGAAGSAAGGSGGSTAAGAAGGSGGGAGTAGTAGNPTGGTGGADCGDVLMSADNCGRCGRSCLGGVCLEGRCEAEYMRTSRRSGNDLELVGNMAIWGAFDRIEWWNRETDAQRVFLAGQYSDFSSVEPVGADVYFLDTKSTSVWKGPVDGSADPTVEFEIDEGEVHVMRGDDSGLYWVACPSTLSLSGDAYRSNHDGTGLQRIALDVACAHVITTDDTHVYVANYKRPEVQRFPKSGTDAIPQQVGQAQPGVFGLAVDDTHAYFCGSDITNNTPRNVYRTEKNGTGSLELLASGHSRCNEIFLDGNFVYWANQGDPATFTDGTIWRVSLDDLQPELLAPGRERPFDIAADPTHIWWLEAGPTDFNANGALYRIPK